MKKILLAVTAALAITGCSQNEEFENAAQKAEINIGTIVKGTSRAAEMTNVNFGSFKVSSFIVANDFDFSTTLLGSPYMDGVEYTGKQGSWITSGDNKYYWPVGKNVQFFGYPSALTLVNPTDAAKGYPTLAFAIGATSAEQTDLVVAAKNTAKPADSNTVTLDFKHILAKINFSYKPEDTSFIYTITEIKITGVKGGNATYTYAADVAVGTWSTGETVAAGYTYPITVASTADASGYFGLDSPDGSLMLLPQDVEGAQIVIKYKTTKMVNSANETFFDGSKTVTLSKDSKWGIGNSIRYKLTLPAGADKIDIATDVKNWEDDNDKPVTPDAN